ncbi:PorT family protein [Chryseotalea sanaruensis]|uniref:PorT family protein n=1 Tax=Chryseotalea sanaruensis TaxID=2482724 RepID=A0A401UDS1_9BACT|nr:outer membrane beta-barrel protein [Chryseotalea sanaruensis]GCC53027.1 PorT family protein [Chryseotalea sanaruensis]
MKQHTPFILILFFSVNLIVCLAVNAQEFSLGVKAGPIMSLSVIADKFDREAFSQQLKFGYGGGGLISFPLKDNYYFVVEGGLSQRGRRILSNDDTWTNISTYYFADASMLLRKSFPFQLKQNIPSKWFINVGPHISYWMGGKGKIGTTKFQDYKIVFDPMPVQPPGTGADFDKMYYSDINRWLFGVDIGVGFVAPLRRKQKIMTELRFTSGHTFYGDTNSAQWRTLGFSDNLRANEKFLTLSAAYIFEFNIKEGKMGKSNKDKEMKRKSVKKRR